MLAAEHYGEGQLQVLFLILSSKGANKSLRFSRSINAIDFADCNIPNESLNTRQRMECDYLHRANDHRWVE